jgi:hypothetical protein
MATDPLPADSPLTLYRGDTRIWEDTFRHKVVPPATGGDPMDLTGYTFLAQVRATQESTAVMATIDVALVDAPGGVIRRTLTAVQARLLVPGNAFWDLQLTAPDGAVRTYLAGKVKVKPDVSRV